MAFLTDFWQKLRSLLGNSALSRARDFMGAFLKRPGARKVVAAPQAHLPPPPTGPAVIRQNEEHPSDAYMKLKTLFRDIGRLNAIAETMGRDFLTAMPESAWKSRLGQIAYLHRLEHNHLTDESVARLLDKAQDHAAQNPSDWDEWDLANLNEMRGKYDLQGALTGDIIEKRARLEYEGRRRHRDNLAQGDWASAREFLTETLDMQRLIGELRARKTGSNSVYQSLMDEYLPGIRTTEVEDWFATLSKSYNKMLPQVLERQAREGDPLDVADFYPAKAQMWLNRALLEAIGFDFQRGGLYETGHNPVEGGTPDDVRLVIKNVDIRNFMDSMKSALHEGGHGLYTQGLPRKTWRYQPVGQDMGSAVQESQALLIEMIIGRTRAFFKFLSPRVEGLFHGIHNPVLSADNLYRIKTRVRPSPVRKTADELTYFFHVRHRFEIERDLVDGKLKVGELPDAWNAKMQDLLGFIPANLAEGCMQDVHWFVGKFGYFPAYTVGHMMAAQMYEHMKKSIPDVETKIAEGQFTPITAWLNEKVHSKGCLMDFPALVKNATGTTLSPDALIRHIDRRYVQAV